MVKEVCLKSRKLMIHELEFKRLILTVIIYLFEYFSVKYNLI